MTRNTDIFLSTLDDDAKIDENHASKATYNSSNLSLESFNEVLAPNHEEFQPLILHQLVKEAKEEAKKARTEAQDAKIEARKAYEAVTSFQLENSTTTNLDEHTPTGDDEEGPYTGLSDDTFALMMIQEGINNTWLFSLAVFVVQIVFLTLIFYNQLAASFQDAPFDGEALLLSNSSGNYTYGQSNSMYDRYAVIQHPESTSTGDNGSISEDEIITKSSDSASKSSESRSQSNRTDSASDQSFAITSTGSDDSCENLSKTMNDSHSNRTSSFDFLSTLCFTGKPYLYLCSMLQCCYVAVSKV